jgi:anaerobic magnesium-protoporphyrin IX monomethyl ester cyclase
VDYRRREFLYLFLHFIPSAGMSRAGDGVVTKVLLIGEKLRFRSFNGANKALPVLASSLHNAGFRSIEQMDLERPELSFERVAKTAETADLILIGGAMTPQWVELDHTLTALGHRLAEYGRDPPVVVGGYAAKSAEDILREQPTITALFDGEGEEGVVHIAEAVARGCFRESRASIKGLCYIDDNGAFRHSAASRVRNLDDINQNYGFVHCPSRHNMEIFARDGVPLKTAQIFSQRGCPWICGFCNKSTESGHVTRISAHSFRSQLRDLRETGFTSVYLDVDTFTVNIEAAIQEAKLLHDEGFAWGTNTRVDRIDLGLMLEFVKLGCMYMFCGVEHINPGVCLAIQKFNGPFLHQVEQAHKYRDKVLSVYRNMKIAGLPSSFFMILALPTAILDRAGERIVSYRATTFEEDIECVSFGIMDCDPDYFNFNLLRFMPGSAAADWAGESAYSCVRPSGNAPVTAGYFLPRVQELRGYRTTDNHGVYRLCESIGPNQPTTTASDPERVYATIRAAIDFINLKRRSGGKLTRLFIDQEILNLGLVSTDCEGCYSLAPLREFESLTPCL